MRVAIGGLHFDHAFADFEHRNIERAAAEIVHGDGLVLTLVEPVGQRGRCRLVDDPLHVEPGDPSGILGGLPLRVVEIRRHGDDRLGDFLAEIIFRRLLQFLQDHRGDLGRSIFLALRHHGHMIPVPFNLIRDHLQFFANLVVAASHEPLDRVDCVLRIGDGLPLGDLPYQPFPGFRESDDRRRSPPTFFIRDHLWLSALHNSYARVGCAEVNSNNLSHNASSKIDKCFIISVMMITLWAIL